MTASAPVLLFDIGGVLCDFSGFEEMHRLLDGQLTQQEIRDRWGRSPSLFAFETGRITPEDFAVMFLDEWNLSREPEAFLSEFKTWPNILFDGTIDLLSSLKGRYLLSCLSNTNSLHRDYMAERYDLHHYFDPVYFSFELGLHKPDPKIFSHVVEDLGVNASDILFFDDSVRNVEAASAYGLQAVHVEGIAAVQVSLRSLDLL